MSELTGKYTIVENPFEETAAIRIDIEPYKGLVYQYGKVDFVEGKPEINFERTIRKLPDHETEEELDRYMTDASLINLMGDILIELLETQINKEKQQNESTK